MKLYRLVKHEKGPLRADTFSVIDDDLITHDVVEIIEITEEGIETALDSLCNQFHLPIMPDRYKPELAKAILSKLKGE